MSRAFNFSAGPAVLPMEVLEEAAAACVNYNNTGMSVMEMSHRSKEYDAIFKEAQADCLKIMNLSPMIMRFYFLAAEPAFSSTWLQ